MPVGHPRGLSPPTLPRHPPHTGYQRGRAFSPPNVAAPGYPQHAVLKAAHASATLQVPRISPPRFPEPWGDVVTARRPPPEPVTPPSYPPSRLAPYPTSIIEPTAAAAGLFAAFADFLRTHFASPAQFPQPLPHHHHHHHHHPAQPTPQAARPAQDITTEVGEVLKAVEGMLAKAETDIKHCTAEKAQVEGKLTQLREELETSLKEKQDALEQAQAAMGELARAREELERLREVKDAAPAPLAGREAGIVGQFPSELEKGVEQDMREQDDRITQLEEKLDEASAENLQLLDVIEGLRAELKGVQAAQPRTPIFIESGAGTEMSPTTTRLRAVESEMLKGIELLQASSPRSQLQGIRLLLSCAQDDGGEGSPMDAEAAARAAARIERKGSVPLAQQFQGLELLHSASPSSKMRGLSLLYSTIADKVPHEMVGSMSIKSADEGGGSSLNYSPDYPCLSPAGQSVISSDEKKQARPTGEILPSPVSRGGVARAGSSGRMAIPPKGPAGTAPPFLSALEGETPSQVDEMDVTGSSSMMSAAIQKQMSARTMMQSPEVDIKDVREHTEYKQMQEMLDEAIDEGQCLREELDILQDKYDAMLKSYDALQLRARELEMSLGTKDKVIEEMRESVEAEKGEMEHRLAKLKHEMALLEDKNEKLEEENDRLRKQLSKAETATPQLAPHAAIKPLEPLETSPTDDAFAAAAKRDETSVGKSPSWAIHSTRSDPERRQLPSPSLSRQSSASTSSTDSSSSSSSSTSSSSSS